METVLSNTLWSQQVVTDHVEPVQIPLLLLQYFFQLIKQSALQWQERSSFSALKCKPLGQLTSWVQLYCCPCPMPGLYTYTTANWLLLGLRGAGLVQWCAKQPQSCVPVRCVSAIRTIVSHMCNLSHMTQNCYAFTYDSKGRAVLYSRFSVFCSSTRIPIYSQDVQQLSIEKFGKLFGCLSKYFCGSYCPFW